MANMNLEGSAPTVHVLSARIGALEATAVADTLERRQAALERAGELELRAGEMLLRASETYGPEGYERWLREELGLTPGDVRGYLMQAKEARRECGRSGFDTSR
jgi:hypothetical protein